MMSTRWYLSAALAVALAASAAGCSRSAASYVERGDAQLKAGNLDAAVLEYRNAVQKDPMSASARQKLAEAYLRQGNRSEAAGEAVRAADLLPRDVGAQLKAGSLLFAVGRAEDAKGRAEKALAIDPKNADAMTLRANALLALRKLDGAIEQLRRAVVLDPSASRQANLGVMLDANGLVDEAESNLRQAVAKDPKAIDAQLALAKFLSRHGRAAEAESSFKTALAADPKNIVANAALADFLIASTRASEAEPYLKALSEASDDPTATLALADYYARSSRPSDAMAVLERLSTSPRAWAVARSRMAAVLFAEGKTAEGHKAIDEVIAKYPGYSEAHVLRGRFLLAEAKLEQALTEAQQAVKAEPRNPDAHFLLGTVQEAQRDLPASAASFNEVVRLNPRSSPAQLRLASINLRMGEYATATQLAEQVVQSDPASLEAHLLVVRGLMGRRDLDRATVACRALVDRFPQAAQAHAEAGLLALLKGDRVGARAALEKALSLDPLLLEPLSNLVAIDISDRQGTRARARIEARLQRTPQDSAVLVVAARTWSATGDQAKAEEFLRRAVAANPANFGAYQYLAFLYVSQKRLDDALAQFEALALKQPNATGPHTMAAMILEAQGKKAEAERRYERIVQADPRAAVAANNLAWMLASRGEQLDRALQLAQAAKAGLPDVAAVSDTLAYVYIRKQLGELAVPLLKQAIQLQVADKRPPEPAYLYHLGLAYVQAGDKAAARRALEDALRLRSDFDGAEDARRLLSTIG